MPPDSELSISLDTIFQGAYEIRAELAAGSFGRLYRARQLSTGQDVAVKILRFHEHEATTAANRRDRFRREMRLCAELSHPNIVRLIDSGETAEGMLYSVFEFVPGATLERLLASEGKLSLAETARLMTQVLDALSCAHARGIIHRDLKPGNIMITKTGVLRNALILDFGLSGFLREVQERNLPRLTATYEMMGTPGYAAPEQLRGEPPSARSDLYSWGLTFLECVTGTYAVSGSGYEVILNQLGPDPVAIPAWLRDQPIGRLLERVIAKRVDERDVTIDALLRALNTPALEEQPAGSPPEAMPLPDGERRQLTLVSCRSTIPPVDDGLGPDVEELDALLRGEHQLFARIAGRNGGHLASVHSNRALLVFGYPRAQEDDARRAARAALQIAVQSPYAAGELPTPHARIEVRIGVHTGLVIARELRGASRALQDVVGFTPQVAAALDEIAAPGEVLASADTHRLLRDEISAECAGEFRFPGSSHPTPVFRLLGDRRVLRRAETIPVRETPLVGRDEQLHQLLRSWGEVQAGRSGAVLISGEAGIGKTRILQELRRRIPADAWFEFRCGPEAQNSSLGPIVDTLAMLAGDSLEGLLARYAMDGDDDVALLATLLSRPIERGRPPSDLAPDRQRELTLDAVLRLLSSMAAERPLVLAIEDLHWADPTTLELVGLLLQELQVARFGESASAPRIYLACTARPEFTPPWAMPMALIQLTRLAREDVEEMVRHVLASGRSLPRPVLEQLIQHADGVPLFVEEVARALVESGATNRGRSPYPDGIDFEVPTSLRDLLTARVDRVSPRARETAQLAAVLGREFRYELLRAASVQEESELREDLAELGGAGLVYRRRSAVDETYVFKHALVRDTAYESMIRSVRRTVHARVADTLTRSFPDLAQSRPEIAAHHAEAGGQVSAAIDYWKRGGDFAMRRGAYAESIRLFERGLNLLAALPSSRERMTQEVGLTESLGTALLATQGYAAPAVEEKFARALALCRELGGDVPLKVLHGIWAVHITRSDRDATADLLPKLQALAMSSRDPVALYTAHGAAGIWAFSSGDFVTARDESARAVQWYHSDALRCFVRDYGYDGRLHAYGWLAWSLSVLGFAEQASSARDEMLELAELTANPYAIALALTFASSLAHDSGDTERARVLSERTIAIATEQKLYFWLATGTCVRGWVAMRHGDIDLAIAEIQRGLGILQAIGIRATYSYYLSFLAEAHLERGAVAEGLSVVDEGLGSCRTLVDRFYEPELYRLQGELRRAERDEAGAEACFRRAIDIASTRSARWFQLRAATSLGRLLRDHANTDEAYALVAGVYDWYTEGLDTPDLRAARALIRECAPSASTRALRSPG
jgi:TOMM system kinase/cyclase fusion protein